MEILTHLAINGIVGLGAESLNLMNWDNVAFFVGSYVLDFDHYLQHSLEGKSLNLMKFIDTHKKYHSEMKPRFYIFHSVEFVSVLFLVCLYCQNSNLWSFFSGWLLHLLSDAFAYMRYYKKDFSWFNYWLLCKWKTLN